MAAMRWYIFFLDSHPSQQKNYEKDSKSKGQKCIMLEDEIQGPC